MAEGAAWGDQQLLGLLARVLAPDDCAPPAEGLRALRRAVRRQWGSATRSGDRPVPGPAPRPVPVRFRSRGLVLGTLAAIVVVLAALGWSVTRGGASETPLAVSDRQLAEAALRHDLATPWPLPPATERDAGHLATSILRSAPSGSGLVGRPHALLAEACDLFLWIAAPLPAYCTIRVGPAPPPTTSPTSVTDG